MNMDFLKTRLMEFLQRHRGRENAIPREKLLFELQSYDPMLSDRQFRDMYSELPICSTARKPCGLFLPLCRQEVNDFLREYATHTNPARVEERRNVFRRAYPGWFSDERQMELFNV